MSMQQSYPTQTNIGCFLSWAPQTAAKNRACITSREEADQKVSLAFSGKGIYVPGFPDVLFLH